MYLAKGIENNYIYLGFESSRKARSFVLSVDGSFVEKMEICRGGNSFAEANARIDGFYDGIFRVGLKNGMHRAFFRVLDENGKAYDTIAFPIFIKNSFACALCTSKELDRGTVTPDEFFGYRTGFVKYNEVLGFTVYEPEKIIEPVAERKETPEPVHIMPEPAPAVSESEHIEQILAEIKPVSEPKHIEQAPVEIKPVEPLHIEKAPEKIEPAPIPAATIPVEPVPAPIEPLPADEKIAEAKETEVLPEMPKTDHKKKSHISGKAVILILALLAALAFLFIKTEKFTNFDYFIGIKENVSTALSSGVNSAMEWFENTLDKIKEKKQTEPDTEVLEPQNEPEEPVETESKPENTYGHELTMDEVLKFLSGEWITNGENGVVGLEFSGFDAQRTVYTCKPITAEEAKADSLCIGGNYYKVQSKTTRSGDYSISEADEINNYGIAIILLPDDKNTEIESFSGRIIINLENDCFTFVSDAGTREKFVRYEH